MLDLLFGPAGSLRSDSGWTSMGGFTRIGRMGTQAGPIVDEDLALTYGAVWACSRLLCESVASLPLQVFQRQGAFDREMAVDFPLFDVVHNLSIPFREGRTLHQINWGNGFAEIERNGRGEVFGLHPIHPTRVLPASPRERKQGIPYKVRNNDGQLLDFGDGDLLHMAGCLSEDGRWGKGTIQHHRESVGFGLGTERHGATYFGSGGQPKGVVTMPGVKDKEKRQTFRAEWKEVHGSPDSSEIAILPLDSTFQPITISNQDGQYLDTRKLNGIVIAQIYRTPPHMIGITDATPRANVEQMALEFVIYSLFPWVRKQEDQYNRKLLTREDRREFFVEHNLGGLLRGDIKTRMNAYRTALQSGIMTINEVRRLENLNGIGPAGDQHYVPLNMTTAERMLREPNPAKVNQTQARMRDVLDPALAIEASADWRDTVRPVLSEALGRMFTKEAKAVERALRNKKLDFSSWLTTFHEKHRGTVRAAVAPACGLSGERLAADDVAQRAISASFAELADAYNRDTHAEMAARLDTWADVMADKVTSQLLGDPP